MQDLRTSGPSSADKSTHCTLRPWHHTVPSGERTKATALSHLQDSPRREVLMRVTVKSHCLEVTMCGLSRRAFDAPCAQRNEWHLGSWSDESVRTQCRSQDQRKHMTPWRSDTERVEGLGPRTRRPHFECPPLEIQFWTRWNCHSRDHQSFPAGGHLPSPAGFDEPWFPQVRASRLARSRPESCSASLTTGAAPTRL